MSTTHEARSISAGYAVPPRSPSVPGGGTGPLLKGTPLPVPPGPRKPSSCPSPETHARVRVVEEPVSSDRSDAAARVDARVGLRSVRVARVLVACAAVPRRIDRTTAEAVLRRRRQRAAGDPRSIGSSRVRPHATTRHDANAPRFAPRRRFSSSLHTSPRWSREANRDDAQLCSSPQPTGALSGPRTRAIASACWGRGGLCSSQIHRGILFPVARRMRMRGCDSSGVHDEGNDRS